MIDRDEQRVIDGEWELVERDELLDELWEYRDTEPFKKPDDEGEKDE